LNDQQSHPVLRPRLRYGSLAHTFSETLDTILWVALLFTVVNLATARFVVDGISMAPNFATGEYILVSRVSYLLGDPSRGDVVVFHYPNNTTQDYIKRVIGEPGDMVEIRDQLVYINGIALDEPYINEPCFSNCADRTWEVGAGEFFVMGDNRNHSSDSRAFGIVKREFIVGEALLRYWPLTNFGSVMDIAYRR